MATNPYQLQADNIKKMYDSSVASMNDALSAQEGIQRAKTEQAVAQLQQQVAPVNQNFDQAAREAYVNRRIAERDMPQALAAVGLNGGASESSRVRLATDYGNQLNALRRDRDTAINDINARIASARAEGDIALGSLQNDFALKRAELQQKYQQQLAEAEMQRQLWALEQQAAARSSSGSPGSDGDDNGGNNGGDNSDPYASATNQYTYPNQAAWEKYIEGTRSSAGQQYGQRNNKAWEDYIKAIRG